MSRNERVMALMAGAAVCAGLLVACATNPVSGKRELALISEAQEIQMGREADPEIVAAYGLYPDERLQQYVQALGTKLAASSERPGLPWTFRVVDDPAVNAFAVPGGFIYITRGILAHMNSEAELAAVMGHEIGHVTARHSVNQMSKQQLAQVGLVAGMILSENVRRYGQAAQASLGLMFLKFGRDDESQSDELGLKYMLNAGYDPRRMEDLFRMLDGVTQQAGGGRLPEWMSSHPDPGNRRAWAVSAVQALNRDLTGLTVNRPPYLRLLNGLVFGENPREGVFQGTVFRHPELAFRMAFPQDWAVSNQKTVVGAQSRAKDAVVTLSLASGTSASAAGQQFASQQGVQVGGAWTREISGYPTTSTTFRATTQQGVLQGLAAWVEFQGRVYQLMGYAPEAAWPGYERVVADAIRSFTRETDPAVLNLKPNRLEVVQLPGALTLDAALVRYPSVVSPQVTALINGLPGTNAFAAGDSIKRVLAGQRP